MAEKRIERRLAAILAADVAGYSRLMGIDEEGTHEALKAYRTNSLISRLLSITVGLSKPPVMAS
jgi:class 3 adenylate cyclase